MMNLKRRIRPANQEISFKVWKGYVVIALVIILVGFTLSMFVSYNRQNVALQEESRAVGMFSKTLADFCQYENVARSHPTECEVALTYSPPTQPNQVLCNYDKGTTTFIYANGDERTFRVQCTPTSEEYTPTSPRHSTPSAEPTQDQPQDQTQDQTQAPSS